MVYSKNDYLIDMVEDLNFYLQSTGLTKCVRGDNIDLFKEDGGACLCNYEYRTLCSISKRNHVCHRCMI